MAEHQLPKLNAGVRFPSPAPKNTKSRSHYDCGIFLVFPVISMFSDVFGSIKYYFCEHHPHAFISALFSKMLTKTWGAELFRTPRVSMTGFYSLNILFSLRCGNSAVRACGYKLAQRLWANVTRRVNPRNARFHKLICNYISALVKR